MTATKPTENIIERIREYRIAFPFTPYEIRTVSGKNYRVRKAHFVAIAPDRSALVVIERGDHAHVLTAAQITGAALIRSRRKRPRRAA